MSMELRWNLNPEIKKEAQNEMKCQSKFQSIYLLNLLNIRQKRNIDSSKPRKKKHLKVHPSKKSFHVNHKHKSANDDNFCKKDFLVQQKSG